MTTLTNTPVLSPLFKWTGGKRRELPTCAPFYPSFVTSGGNDWKFVEPFVGGGAVYWSLANPNSVINDYDTDVMNFYTHVKTQDPDFLDEVATVTHLFRKNQKQSSSAVHDQQEAAYYRLRDLDRNGGLKGVPNWKRAARFFVVNQLAFSGMRRFNSSGEFNVPFGHYKSFNASALTSAPHVNLLSTTTLTTGDYASVLAAHDTPNTFIYIDPPYTRVMKTYSAGATFGNTQQEELRDALAGLEHASFMVVIDSSAVTEALYKDFVVHRYPVSYGVNIKNRFSQAAHHLIAVNYRTANGHTPPICA